MTREFVYVSPPSRSKPPALMADGASKWKRSEASPPTFFFAPDHVRRRGREWGREGLDARVMEAWRPFVEWCGTWLQVARGQGGDAVKTAYLELLEGRSDPTVGHLLSP